MHTRGPAPVAPAAEPALHAPLAEHAHRGRYEDDAEIAAEPADAHVATVQEPRYARAAPGVDLSEADDTGANAPAHGMTLRRPCEAHDVGPRQRPRPDEAHVAAQHVDELRQLVEARGA